MWDMAGGVIELTWVGVNYKSGKVLTNVGTSAVPSYLTSAPPTDSDCGDWFENTNSNTVLFELTGTVNTTNLDIELDVKYSDNVSGVVVVTTTTSNTTGQIYYNALDGTTNKWVSQGDPITH